jgi:hypothetical protein
MSGPYKLRVIGLLKSRVKGTIRFKPAKITAFSGHPITLPSITG